MNVTTLAGGTRSARERLVAMVLLGNLSFQAFDSR